MTTLRQAYLAETEGLTRLATSQPPVTITVRHEAGRDGSKHYLAYVEQEPPSASGYTISGGLLSLIESASTNLDDEAGGLVVAFYGNRWPVRKALSDFERYCRRAHKHWADHTEVAVCAQLAWATIRDGASLRWAAEHFGLAYPRAERVLKRAEEYVARSVDRSVTISYN
jgi:hypothetical protein